MTTPTINNPNTGYPFPGYTWRSVGSAKSADLTERRDEIDALLRGKDRPVNKGYLRQLDRERQAINDELSERRERYDRSKSDPYDHAHGYDRD